MNAPTLTRLDPALWLERALAVLALRLRQEVAMTRALRGPDRQEGFLGLFLSDEEAEAILAEASGRLQASGTAETADGIEQLQRELANARNADPHAIWRRLADVFDLSEAELDLIFLAAAPALDPRFGRVYGYLNDDMARRHLTPALAQRLLDRHDIDALSLRRILAPDSPLVTGRLILPGDERPFVETALRIDESLLNRLLGNDAADGRLDPFRDVVRVPVPGGAASGNLWLLVSRPPADPGPFIFDLAAGSSGRVMAIDFGRFAGLDRQAIVATVGDCLREARLDGLLPVLTGFDLAGDGERRAVAGLLASPAVLVTAKPKSWEDAGLSAHHARVEALAAAARSAWIERLLEGHPADSPDLRAQVARMPRLGLLPLALLLARHRDADRLKAAVDERTVGGLAGLAQPITSEFTLDDLVLPPKAVAALRGLIAWQETLATVLADWRFGRVFGKSASTTVLFKGPSGTGKTMAASVIANALGLTLFRVDLAGLVSKYIGETEKNLDKVFEAAETADTILFFDECDAIFARRSEVNDAHDRYANLGTSYLLQRLESHEGISILASNLHDNIDDAFLRRIDKVVEFPPPGVSERLAIWQRIGATGAPLADDVDLDLLAERHDLTGGEIRNCMLEAAHRAACQDRPIAMADLVVSVGREFGKQGKPIRKTDFGAFYALLRSEEGAS